jgi:hypothetical protein|tara:strand:- start:487 stop:789 length:303 start_codon:yes stop_codon:yes gene_type:complete
LIERGKQLLSNNTEHTMNKFTTDRYDGQRCQVSIVSSSITIQGENNAVEIRFLDEAYLLDAVCSYIKYRHLDSNKGEVHRRLLDAVCELGNTIGREKANA